VAKYRARRSINPRRSSPRSFGRTAKLSASLADLSIDSAHHFSPFLSMTRPRITTWKKALCLGLAAGALTAFVLLFGCATAPHALPFTPAAESSRPHRVFVVGHGWHVGLVLPAAPLAAHHPALKARFSKPHILKSVGATRAFIRRRKSPAGSPCGRCFIRPVR
jgi:hypothetical protein